MRVLVFILLLVPVSAFAIDLGVVGNIYDISERDILEEIEERAAKVDMGAIQEKVHNKIKEKAGKVNFDYPRVEKDETYYIDLTTSLEQAIMVRDKQGRPQVIYPKGFKFNVLDHVKIRKRYIIFNSDSKEEVAWYIAKYSKDINSVPILSRGSAIELSNKIKREVFILDTPVADKFKIRATPTVVYQEGNKLRADNIYLPIEDTRGKKP